VRLPSLQGRFAKCLAPGAYLQDIPSQKPKTGDAAASSTSTARGLGNEMTDRDLEKLIVVTQNKQVGVAGFRGRAKNLRFFVTYLAHVRGCTLACSGCHAWPSVAQRGLDAIHERCAPYRLLLHLQVLCACLSTCYLFCASPIFDAFTIAVRIPHHLHDYHASPISYF